MSYVGEARDEVNVTLICYLTSGGNHTDLILTLTSSRENNEEIKKSKFKLLKFCEFEQFMLILSLYTFRFG